MRSRLLIGCIADDFTGGSDAASFIAAGGLNTILVNGCPDEDFDVPQDAEAIVIALKSRTQETREAVSDSLNALFWLHEKGAQTLYVKYCSTFDSTPEGNIGPVVDAAMEAFDCPYTLLCPSLPANGRTVRGGVLYVNGIPLGESSMKNHPLTPMWASRISELIKPQSRYESLELSLDLLNDKETAITETVTAFAEGKDHFYLIPDYETDEDAERIVSLFGGIRLLTGGSGLLDALARYLRKKATSPQAPEHLPEQTRGNAPDKSHAAQADGTAPGKSPAAQDSGYAPDNSRSGKAIIVAGSCSEATRKQREKYLASGGTCVKIENSELSDPSYPRRLWESVKDDPSPLIYSYASPDELKAMDPETKAIQSAAVENCLASIAAFAAKSGTTRIIAAGGETSGAVTMHLQYSAFRIGRSIAPGVPVLIPLTAPQIRLVLKSGNFGQEDFFERTLSITEQ